MNMLCKIENWYKPLVDCVSVKAHIFLRKPGKFENFSHPFLKLFTTSNVKEKWKTFSKLGGLLRIYELSLQKQYFCFKSQFPTEFAIFKISNAEQLFCCY